MRKGLRPGPVLSMGVFWGSIWGLYEATVGFVIHSVPRVPGAASVLVVPFAVFCLFRATRAAGARGAATAAAVAAAIKLTDFLLPVLTPLSVLKPASAILLEGMAFLAVAGALRWPARARTWPALAMGGLAFNLLWRALFLAQCAVLGWTAAVGSAGPIPLDFLLRDAVLSTAALMLLWAVARLVPDFKPIGRPSPRFASGLLVLAIMVELATRLA